jgi:PKD repeat protein
MMKTTRKIMISAAILTLLLGVITSVSAETTEIVTDGEDDVIIISEDMFSGETEDDITFERTSEKPNIDITKLTYIGDEDSTQVTLKLEVNSRGVIEDRNDLEDIDPNATTFTGTVITYSLSLETSEDVYEIEYIAGNCTVNYEPVTATKVDNELSVTFDLESSDETFVSLSGTTMQFDLNSLTDIKYYMDVAPDSELFEAILNGPTSAETGEEIEFTGDYEDTFGLTASPYTYTWNFDDGTTSTQQNPTHTYQNPGDYYVKLTVEDSTGLSSEDSIKITVTAGSSTNGDTTNGDSTNDSDGGSGLLMFIAVIAVIVIIGVVALIFVIRR